MNEVILITGATGKLGRQIAHGFSGEKDNIIITARSLEKAMLLEKECLELGASGFTILLVDLIDGRAVDTIKEELKVKNLYPTILINNARNMDYLVMEEGYIKKDRWVGEFSLGVITPYDLAWMLAFEPMSHLKKIINISSIYGVTAPNLNLYTNPNQSPVNYGVAKAALIHLTKELAVRLAAKRIAVNAVSFGGVEGRVDDDFKRSYARLCPTARMLQDEEIFGPIRFLASAESSGMNGHNLIVDGGWTIW